ncbi:hypothetical protein BLOT_013600 [Blomia tropicalis]|nr:hypothetical protein BLOT_013600 [Blomia tropicalis]
METEQQQQQQQQQPNGQQVQSAQTTPQSMASNHTSTNSSEVVTHDGSYDQDLFLVKSTVFALNIYI